MHSLLRRGVEVSSDSRNHNRIAPGTLRITAQCVGIPEAVQRPLSPGTVAAVQLNVGDGSTGEECNIEFYATEYEWVSAWSTTTTK